MHEHLKENQLKIISIGSKHLKRDNLYIFEILDESDDITMDETYKRNIEYFKIAMKKYTFMRIFPANKVLIANLL